MNIDTTSSPGDRENRKAPSHVDAGCLPPDDGHLPSTGRRSRQIHWPAILMVCPLLIGFAIFTLYPLAQSLRLSFYNTAGAGMEKPIGLGNYRFLLTDVLFWLSVANTLFYTIAFIIVQVPLSLALALLLTSRRIRGKSFLRLAFFSVHLVGSVFMAALFALMLTPGTGLIARLFSLILPADMDPLFWRTTPWLVVPIMVVASAYLTVGWGMIYLMAALQAVDPHLHEAAAMDGAGRFSRFWHVTLPGIRPVLGFLVLAGAVGAMQVFELPFILFNGPGPGFRGLSIVMYLYSQGFDAGNLGYAAAIGWVMTILFFTLSLGYIRAGGLSGEKA